MKTYYIQMLQSKPRDHTDGVLNGHFISESLIGHPNHGKEWGSIKQRSTDGRPFKTDV